MEYSSYNVNTPQWREITVGSHLPAELRKLAEIAHNLSPAPVNSLFQHGIRLG